MKESFGTRRSLGGIVRRVLPGLAVLALLFTGLSIDIALRGSRTVDLPIADEEWAQGGFYEREWSDALPAPAGPQSEAYRWMGQSGRLRLGPVREGWPVVLRLRMFSGRPAEVAWPQLHISANGTPLASLHLAPSVEEYAFLLPPDTLRDGRLALDLYAETFPATDARDLSIVLMQARLEVVGAPYLLQQPLRFLVSLSPAYLVVGLAAAAVALALGLRFWPAWGVGAGVLVLATVFSAWRPDLARRSGPALAVGALVLVGTAVLRRLGGRRWGIWMRRLWAHAGLASIALLVFLSLLAYFLSARLGLFFLVNGAVLGSYFLLLRLRYDSLAEAGAGAFLLAAFQVLASQMVLGALGWLNWEMALGINLVLALVLLVVLRRHIRPLLQGTWLRGLSFWKSLSPFPKAVVALLLLAAIWSALVVWFVPVHDWDGNNYHVPIAILRAQQGNLDRLEGFSAFIEAYPENSEFWVLWTLLGTGTQTLADGVPLAFWLAGMLALYSLARRLGANPGPALLGAALWGLAPVALSQTRTAFNDLTLAALFWLGMNFAFRRPVHLGDALLSAVSVGLLLGIKYHALLFVAVLALVALVHAGRDILRRGWVAVAVVVLLGLVALSPGLFWYVSNWVHYGNPVWPYAAALGPLQFRGPAPLSIGSYFAPPLIREMPLWQQLWTVWMEHTSFYDCAVHLGGLGPLWIILGIPALAAWVVAERRGWLLILLSGAILVLHPDPWWTRFVLYLPGLGGIALAVVLSRVRVTTRWIAQVIFLGGSLYSLLVASDVRFLPYFFVPPAYRTQGYLWPDLYVYRWFDANSRDRAPVFCEATGGILALSALAGERLDHPLYAIAEVAAVEEGWVAGQWPTGQLPFPPVSSLSEQPATDLPAASPQAYRYYFPWIERHRPGQALLGSFVDVSLAVLSRKQFEGTEPYGFAIYRVSGHRAR